jgi:hypothetical protein
MRYSYIVLTLFLTSLPHYFATLFSDGLVRGIALAVALLVGVFAVVLYRKPLAARRCAANQALLTNLLRRPPGAERQKQTGKVHKAA